MAAPRSPAVIGARVPRNLPTGVRIGLTMAARFMAGSPPVRRRGDRPGGAGQERAARSFAEGGKKTFTTKDTKDTEV